MANYKVQKQPFVIPTTDGKSIKEHFGIPSTETENISIAHMKAPAGWSEPFQTPEFDEFTFIIKGKKQFIIDGETIVISAGESIFVPKHTRVQYSNPFLEPCEYLAICTPAFEISKANRED